VRLTADVTEEGGLTWSGLQGGSMSRTVLREIGQPTIVTSMFSCQIACRISFMGADIDYNGVKPSGGADQFVHEEPCVTSVNC